MARTDNILGDFLATFTGLQEMERQRRLDSERMAQQAVDNELRRMGLRQKDEAQRQTDLYRDELNVIRQDRLTEQARHNKELEEARADTLGRQEKRDAQLAQERRARMRNQGLARGETEREARLSAAMTNEEIDAEMAALAQAQMPGAVQAQKAAVGQNMQSTVAPALANAIGAMLGIPPQVPIGGAVPVPGLPTIESVGNEQSKAFLEASERRKALAERTELLNKQTAKQIEFDVEMRQKLLRAKDRADELAQSQALINKARYEELLANKGLAREKFQFDKYIRDGQLDIAKANVALRRLEVDLAKNRDIRADNNERKGLEAMFNQLKSDKQDIFLKSRIALDEAESVRKGIVEGITRLKYPAIMGTGPLPADAQARIVELEQKLAEYSPEYIGKLRRDVKEAERSRNEAHNVWVKARDLYSTPMTLHGKPAIPVRGGTMPFTPKKALPYEPRRIQNAQEYKSLLTGEVYIDPDGVRRTKR